MQSHRINESVTVLSDHAEIPGLGFLPVNTFVIHAEQPVVVDTGLSTPDKDFVADLGEIIDPADVRWIWISHPDRDHTGGLWQLLDAAPNAQIVTTFLGVGIMSCQWAVPMDRVYFLNPGQALNVGDRHLHAFRPPLFDNPSTTGFLDSSTGALFTSDCFGGPMPTAELASCGDVREAGSILDETQLLWAAVDSPWIHSVDPVKFRATIDPLRSLDPSAILSTHLPPAVGLNDALFATIETAPDCPPFVGPDQAALTALLATFEPA